MHTSFSVTKANSTESDLLDILESAVDDFVHNDPGRSVLLQLWSGQHQDLSIARHADEPRPGASLLKLVLVLALDDAVKAGQFSWKEQVKVANLAKTFYPNIITAFADDEHLTLRQLCGFSLITSDNSASEYLRQRVGKEALDRTITRLGLADTKFAAGFADADLDSTGRANITTAADCARIFRAIYDTERLAYLRRFLINNLRNQRLPLFLDDDIQVMHKTGSLKGVVNDAGVILFPDLPIFVAVLCDGQEKPEQCALEIGRLGERVATAVTPLR